MLDTHHQYPLGGSERGWICLIDDLAQQFGADIAFAARAGLVLQRPNPPSEIAPSPLRDLVIVHADAPSDRPDPHTLSR